MIRVFIGTEPKTHIPCQVLQHSIWKRTDETVMFQRMLGEEWEVPSDLHQGTGFSLRRFLIPDFCAFQGRAIYLDADQIVLSDINELWNYPDSKPESSAWCTYQKDKHFKATAAAQTSVMVLNCESCKWNYKELFNALRQEKISYPDLMHFRWNNIPGWGDKIFCVEELPVEWNVFNHRGAAACKLLHYTRESQQPWYNPAHPEKDLWRDELLDAMRSGFVTNDDLRHALALWSPPTKQKRAEGMHPYWEKFVK